MIENRYGTLSKISLNYSAEFLSCLNYFANNFSIKGSDFMEKNSRRIFHTLFLNGAIGMKKVGVEWGLFNVFLLRNNLMGQPETGEGILTTLPIWQYKNLKHKVVKFDFTKDDLILRANFYMMPLWLILGKYILELNDYNNIRKNNAILSGVMLIRKSRHNNGVVSEKEENQFLNTKQLIKDIIMQDDNGENIIANKYETQQFYQKSPSEMNDFIDGYIKYFKSMTGISSHFNQKKERNITGEIDIEQELIDAQKIFIFDEISNFVKRWNLITGDSCYLENNYESSALENAGNGGSDGKGNNNN